MLQIDFYTIYICVLCAYMHMCAWAYGGQMCLDATILHLFFWDRGYWTWSSLIRQDYYVSELQGSSGFFLPGIAHSFMIMDAPH